MEQVSTKDEPKRSFVTELQGGGKSYSFSTLDDYIEWYKSKKIIKDKNDLIENRSHLISEIFFDWIESGQVGCIFAMHLARDASSTSLVNKSKVRWETLIQSHPLEQNDLPGHLNETLDTFAKVADAVQVVFPTIESEEAIVNLINRLCENDRWYWTEIAWNDGEARQRLIGLRWILPEGLCVNHVLGFAPLPTMPVTRRAPFAALVLRVATQKREPKRKFEDHRLVVHLADIDSGLRPQSKHDQISEATSAYKRQLLPPEVLPSTRAMITFQLGFEISQNLCEPKKVEVKERTG